MRRKFSEGDIVRPEKGYGGREARAVLTNITGETTADGENPETGGTYTNLDLRRVRKAQSKLPVPDEYDYDEEEKAWARISHKKFLKCPKGLYRFLTLEQVAFLSYLIDWQHFKINYEKILTNRKGYFYCPTKVIQKQTHGLSEKIIYRLFKELEELGIIHTYMDYGRKAKRTKKNPTRYSNHKMIRIFYRKMERMIQDSNSTVVETEEFGDEFDDD